MDDRRFDTLTRAFASAANRRSLIKGLLGLGGAAAVGGTVLETDSRAARRPAPTPKPPTCPGQQTSVNGQCVCQVPPALGPQKCGPDCCTPAEVGPGHSECCDQACCFGTCYGEELCCPTNPRAGGLPPLAEFCSATGECCLAPSFCCDVDGCCDTVCFGGDGGDDFCCPADEFCSGGTDSPDLCCTGDTPIQCACGTNDNACIADNDEACCDDTDCDSPPEGSTRCVVGSCTDHVCVYTDCASGTEVCCPDNQGVYACRVGDECCLTSETCADTCEVCVDYACADDPNTFPCGPENDPYQSCCPQTATSICCDRTHTCVDLGLDRACCADADCDQPPDACSSGTCDDDNLCSYRSPCDGECCPDGFCNDDPGECCDDLDCPAIGCLTGTCVLESHTCAYSSITGFCGDCGVCTQTGACAQGTCAGACEICVGEGTYNCQNDPNCCPAYMVPSPSGCVNPCEPDPCPGNCWCAAYADGSTICAVNASNAGGCSGPGTCAAAGFECMYSGLSNQFLCLNILQGC